MLNSSKDPCEAILTVSAKDSANPKLSRDNSTYIDFKISTQKIMETKRSNEAGKYDSQLNIVRLFLPEQDQSEKDFHPN
jgi:hypothetical protein